MTTETHLQIKEKITIIYSKKKTLYIKLKKNQNKLLIMHNKFYIKVLNRDHIRRVVQKER